VPDPIGEWEPSFSTATFALVERAGVAVRELNATGEALVSLEGLARQLLRSEALASSRIEGLTVSHRKLAQAALGDDRHAPHRAQEVLGNMRAMEAAVQVGAATEALTVDDLCAIHRTLAIVPPLDRIAGQLRREQGWIGGATPADASFVPPPHTEVERLTRDLCSFANRDDIPAVAQAAIAHAQFETIHPFGDGNGRVGRCLIHVLLRRRGLASRYVPPVSLVLGASKDRYIDGLVAFRDDRVEEWVAQFALAVEAASRHAASFSERVRALQARWLERAGPLRGDAVARTIVAHLPAFPFITSAIGSELSGKSDVAVLRGLDRLTRAGVLTRHRNPRKGDTWEAKELFTLLDELEQAVLATRVPATHAAR
jgi:Fic family protein